MLNEIETDIRDRLMRAKAGDDISGIIRSLKDLESIGWKDVRIVSRHILIDGTGFELSTYLDGRQFQKRIKKIYSMRLEKMQTALREENRRKS
jgi:hypothetical protein